jgi:hypothetical protein
MFRLTSAIIRCMQPQVEIQVIKVKYTTELNSDLKRTAIEHSCSFTTIKLVIYNVLKMSSGRILKNELHVQVTCIFILIYTHTHGDGKSENFLKYLKG